jgi:serine/threonine protein kinase
MIADFGVSQLFKASNAQEGDDSKKVQHGGTPAFMSPELWESETHPGPPVDIWAMGVTLYVMLFNSQPFVGKNEFLLMSAIQESEVSYPADIDPILKDLFVRMFDKNPVTRITMNQLMEHPWVSNSGSEPLIR